jgi:hypothetical protein
VFHFQVIAQDEVIAQLPMYFKMGDSRAMTRLMSDLVEININGVKGMYSKTQADLVLKDFFRKYNPTDYQNVHQGSSREGLYYSIGKYLYNGGAFQVYIVLKYYRGNYIIDSIDFNRE